MFYTKFCELAKQKGSTPTGTLVKLGMSRGNLERWRNGGSPTGDVLKKIAEHFNVSIDYLLGKDEELITDSQLKFALFGDVEIDDDVLDEAKRAAKLLQQLKNERKKEQK